MSTCLARARVRHRSTGRRHPACRPSRATDGRVRRIRMDDGPVLSCADVLEQEYLALHPDERRVDETLAVSEELEVTADDIIDLPGLARALLDARARRDAAAHPEAWQPRPPAPPDSPMTELGALVCSARPELADALEVTLARYANGATIDADGSLRAALAAALTGLLHEHIADRTSIETTFGSLLRSTEQRRLFDVRRRIHAKGHAALCLSGGGIRSASFAMGVIQGLARRGLLSRFDYLSTVSGGGYTGSWLSAWMARSGPDVVHSQLRGTQGSRGGKADPDPAPLKHIRTYSAFLNPSFGLFSADTWTLLATIARNIILIWLVTLPLLA